MIINFANMTALEKLGIVTIVLILIRTPIKVSFRHTNHVLEEDQKNPKNSNQKMIEIGSNKIILISNSPAFYDTITKIYGRITLGLFILLIVATFLFCSNNVAISKNHLENSTITVNAPSDMKLAFKAALKNSALRNKRELLITDSKYADLVVSCKKEPGAKRFAYSPFVLIYGGDIENLRNANVLVTSEATNNEEINLLEIVTEVTERAGVWAEWDINGYTKINILHPSKDSEYWNAFYNLMLVTANNGIYPKNEMELKSAQIIVESFLNSDCTQGVSNLKESAKRLGGTCGNTFIILPENVALSLSLDYSPKVFYPLATVYCNYYVKGNELGKELINSLETQGFLGYNFYAILRSLYRCDKYFEIDSNFGTCGISNNFNVIDVPESA